MRSCIFLLVFVAALLLGSHDRATGAANQVAKLRTKKLSSNKNQEIREREHQSTGGIKHVAIVGERHSGTNFMRLLLQVNLKKSINVTDHFCDYKHAYQAPNANCLPLASTLVIVMFRNPYDWAFAMHRRCWCAFSTGSQEAAMRMATLDFRTFLTQPWRDDSIKPWTQEKNISVCENVMQCRAFKYLNFLNISNWAPNVEFVRHEDVLAPHLARQWLMEIVPRYGLPLTRDKVKAVKKYKQSESLRFDPKAAKKKSVWFNKMLVSNNSTLKSHVQLISNTMNPLVESMVGYSRYSSSKDLDRVRVELEKGGKKKAKAGGEQAGEQAGGGMTESIMAVGDAPAGEAAGKVEGRGSRKRVGKHRSRADQVLLVGAEDAAGGEDGSGSSGEAASVLSGWWDRLWRWSQSGADGAIAGAA